MDSTEFKFIKLYVSKMKTTHMLKVILYLQMQHHLRSINLLYKKKYNTTVYFIL